MYGAMILRGRGRTAILRAAAVLAALGCALALVLAGPSRPANAAAVKPVADSFGQGFFGISSDGSLQNESPRTLTRDLNAMQQTGAHWLRVSINWAQIQYRRRGPLFWSNIDRVVKGAEARGFSILGVMLYTPRWAEQFKSCKKADCAPNPVAFARFAKLAVAHYSRLGVHDYEIWSEENSTAQWLPKPDPAAYARLLKLAYPVIKKADPRSTVITGGTSPAPTDGTNYRPVDFLIAMYKHGARGHFDAVGAHPYCWPAYAGQPYEWSAWYQTYGARKSMRNVMLRNGDGNKLIWGTEFGAPTGGPKGGYVTRVQQGRMIYAGYKLWATYRWAGPLILYEGRDQGHDKSSYYDFMGLQYHNFVRKPAFKVYQLAVQTI